jgi:RimJ/RimL family protein N-acetyltransferase
MLYLREATEQDLELMMAWRSNPLVYEGFYTQTEPLKWEEHLKWWESRNRDWRTLIIVLVSAYKERRVGVVTIGQLDHWSPEIGYYLGEVSLWGKGFGKEAVKLGLNWLRERGYKWCHTTVLVSNKRSAGLLWKLGFQAIGPAREGELWLTKNL